MSHQIDADRPMTIYGSITRDLSKMPEDPMHGIATKMAREYGNSAFTRLADPVAEARIEVPAKAFLNWLEALGLAEEFLRDLQCVSETDNGEPLLTSWTSWNRFLGVISGSGGTLAEGIKAQVQEWRSFGLDEVYFDFYAKPASQIATSV